MAALFGEDGTGPELKRQFGLIRRRLKLFFSWGGSGDCLGEPPRCGSRYEVLGGVVFVHGGFVRRELVRESVQILRFGRFSDVTSASSSVLGHSTFDNRREDVKSSSPLLDCTRYRMSLTDGWIVVSLLFPGGEIITFGYRRVQLRAHPHEVQACLLHGQHLLNNYAYQASAMENSK